MQINDVHISDTPPRMRTATYREDVLAKLAACVAIANAERVDRIIVTGDVFHRKRARDTSHRTIQAVRAILHTGPPVSIVPGNHDEAHGGGLGGQPLLSVLDEHITLFDGPSVTDPLIAGVPWSNAFEREGGLEAFAEAVRSAGAPLIFTHAPISDRPFPFGPEAQGWLLRDDVAAALENSGAQLIAHGHFHLAQDEWDSENWILFTNPGALARASIAEDDRDRAPQVAIIHYRVDPRGGSYKIDSEYIEVPHRPAAEVFRIAEHEAAVARNEGVTALSAALSSAYSEIIDAEYLAGAVRAQARPDGINEGDWRAGQELAIAAIDGEE
jgi:DNA repair exonuclease SbcCD nuclease subunit